MILIEMHSPYFNKPKDKWPEITESLIAKHPLDENEIVEFVLTAWENIFFSTFGKHKLRIGVHIFPKPQIMGALLHELIPAEISANYPKEWRGEISADEKDIVYIPNDFYSIELKTSSNPSKIFGNRSFAQKSSKEKKAKMDIT